VTGDLDGASPAQRIRGSALGYALHLETTLPPPLSWRTDDLSPGEEVTERDTAVMNERIAVAEQAIADRVLRHARLFAEYIRSGFDGELELDGLTTLDGDRQGGG